MASEQLDTSVVDLFDEWVARTPNRIAAEWQGETLTYAGLRDASLHVSKALLSAGVPPRAKVPVLTKMSLEMLPAIIGILRVGACYVPIDLGVWSRSRAEDVLRELAAPVAIVTTPCPELPLPTITVNFQKEWLSSPLIDASGLCAQLDLLREGLRADDLIWIVFTSGTTGRPKGVMIYHRGISSLAKVIEEGNFLRPAKGQEMRVLLPFSIAFDGCSGVVWITLTKGRTLAMASPSTFPEVASTCQVWYMTPSMLATLSPSGPYDGVRYICLGAEAPSLEVARQWIRPGRKVLNTYGPSETTVIISLGEILPNEEIDFGEFIPGVKVVLVDEDLRECEHGEVMIAGPGVAAGYYKNPEQTSKKFIEWNGERYYRTGDLARRTEKGLVWAGRADFVVKNRGFLINLETEVEPALVRFAPVRRAAAFKWRDQLVGCVEPAAVNVEELRVFMKRHCDPFIIPDRIMALDEFPLNVNGKTDRNALRARLEESASQDEDLLEHKHDLSVHDTLRLAFARCLHVSTKDLDQTSSFSRLGGNSLMAIQFSRHMRERGLFISIQNVLRLDTIAKMETYIEREDTPDDSVLQEYDSSPNIELVPAPDLQKLLLSESQQNPVLNGIVCTLRYDNSAAAHTPNEFRDAWVQVLSAHSIFRTRFDLSSWTLSDLGQLNYAWQEISVDMAQFENTVAAVGESAWLGLKTLDRSNLDVPYCHVTCIYVPESTTVAFIWRVHHVLTDGFSSGILLQDFDSALAGETIPQGPRFRDFALFMHNYKRHNLDKATTYWEKMLQPLSSTPLLKIPRPGRPQSQSFCLLDFPTTVSKDLLDSVVREHGITRTTVMFAAWALALCRLTRSSVVAFSLNLSGRMLPWTSATSLVGALMVRAPFCTTILSDTTVHEWLAGFHREMIDVGEFQSLSSSLPPSMLSNKNFNTLADCELDNPELPGLWEFHEKQYTPLPASWIVSWSGEHVSTTLNLDPRVVDLYWAKQVGGIAVNMIEGLVHATEHAIVRDLCPELHLKGT